jgi:ketosteroid isomerase-like protein
MRWRYVFRAGLEDQQHFRSGLYRCGLGRIHWNFSAKRRKEGSSVSFDGMETQIYRKNHDRWCVVHVHYSTLPAEKKAGTE